MKKNDKFEIIENTQNPNVEIVDETINDNDFELVDSSTYSHEQKFETKPTTFLKDSLKRFSKNKSSVVAAWILGILISLSFIIPVVVPSDVKNPHEHEIFLQPKLFDSGFGFWDGCKNYSDIAYDEDSQSPDPQSFNIHAISNLKVDDKLSYVNTYNAYAKGGYLNLSALNDDLRDSIYLKSTAIDKLLVTSSYDMTITLFDETYNYYQRAPYSIYFTFEHFDATTLNYKKEEVRLFDQPSTNWSGTYTYNIMDLINTEFPTIYKDEITNFQTVIELDITNKEIDSSILIESIVFTTDNTDENYVASVTAPSFTDANKMIGTTNKNSDGTINKSYWSCDGDKFLYKAQMRKCSFTYDTYAAAFGKKTIIVDEITMRDYKQKKWCDFESFDKIMETFKVLSDKCPVIEVKSVSQSGESIVTYNIECDVTFYKYLGYSSMPRYLFGTDASGKDMLKYVFEGLRTSLLLGVVTFVVCFLFGLCWGAISGYFGGAIDLAMERFTDILGGLPWIVMMTLCIIHLGQNFTTFAIALCLTGWIGTSHTTRTQFYRFKRREYVLASRTLGAKDFRLIFKHILPNAMGTIITGAVLMIPSVIFSEATISYLGLGLQGMSSLGVILSDNQSQILQNPYLLIFPAVVISLLMITFNLFGNGLRDAVNPSLKGEGE